MVSLISVSFCQQLETESNTIAVCPQVVRVQTVVKYVHICKGLEVLIQIVLLYLITFS